MKRILVVDDEPFILYGLCNTLWDSQGEWKVEAALDANEAREKLREQKFDVIVCDLHMPGQGGEALLRHVMAEYPDIGRVVLTGDGSSDAALQVLDVCERFLQKPCPPNVLREAIQEVGYR